MTQQRKKLTMPNVTDEQIEQIVETMFNATGMYGFDGDIMSGKMGVSAGVKLTQLIKDNDPDLRAMGVTALASKMAYTMIRTMVRDAIREGMIDVGPAIIDNEI